MFNNKLNKENYKQNKKLYNMDTTEVNSACASSSILHQY